jgi:hypothetical protein
LGDFLGSIVADEGPKLFFLLGNEGLVFALAPLAVMKAALFLFPLLKLLSIGFVGDVGDGVPEGDGGDLLEAETDSETEPVGFKVEGDAVEDVGTLATSEAGSAIA